MLNESLIRVLGGNMCTSILMLFNKLPMRTPLCKGELSLYPIRYALMCLIFLNNVKPIPIEVIEFFLQIIVFKIQGTSKPCMQV